jgi:uncharacterized protein YndB with AHSA1/START domain
MSLIDDRIEKRIVLKAPVARVWQAVSDARQFGAWFGVEFEGPFVAGAPARGRLVPTSVDSEIASYQEAHRGTPFNITVDRIEPMRLFSFRWHPYAIDPLVDYSAEPMTLIEFELEEAGGATTLTITESGFASIPLERRVQAFPANQRGWEAQIGLIQKYVVRHGG